MKFRKSAVAAVIAAAALSMTTAFPASAATVSDLPAAVTAYEGEEDLPRVKSEAEAANYFLQEFKKHNTNIDFLITEPEDDDYERISDRITSCLKGFSGIPDEGVYLSMEATTRASSIYPTKDGFRFTCTSTFITTVEQEAQVTEEIQKIRQTPEFKAAYNDTPYNKIRWAYDYVTRNMVLTDDLMDTDRSSAYSVLFNHEANEEGQIHFLIRLLGEMNVPCEPYVTNLNSLTEDSLDAHFLCIAQIRNYNYFLDPVWDKKLKDTGRNFFMKGYIDLDSKNGGKADFTHIHLFQLFSFGEEVPLEDEMKELGISPNAYPLPEYFSGDINDDGSVNSVDTSNVLAEYARLSTSDHTGIFTDKQQKAADVDNNGAIDAVDASKILSYYAYASTNDYPMSIENYLS
ncbi:dockerin type I domain-containing protein [Ruminococcus sp.]|uniref:dockerin type I domain-containing protein n=1 Tax=Ruminococcus sp. TaxID=41978 RepID=UPI002BD755A2|nr:dockerin type I domain-containing protein [Ruminococcus sp.]HNZ99731.1 dockerin type I domain-containing protein [Ruminococcus sp.]